MDAAATDNTALERSAYRKASLRILPLIALGHGAAYIDRVTGIDPLAKTASGGYRDACGLDLTNR